MRKLLQILMLGIGLLWVTPRLSAQPPVEPADAVTGQGMGRQDIGGQSTGGQAASGTQPPSPSLRTYMKRVPHLVPSPRGQDVHSRYSRLAQLGLADSTQAVAPKPVLTHVLSREEGFDAPSFVTSNYKQGDFRLVDGDVLADVYVDSQDAAVARHAADLLAGDVNRVTGHQPAVQHEAASLGAWSVLIGTLGQSAVIDKLVKEGKINVGGVKGQWESFVIQTVANPLPNVKEALVIAGSDRRGTAYGVFEVSQQIGVSPWYWWADVPADHHDKLIIKHGRYRVGPPSVKYRGIFINDEDWGIRPWSAHTFDRKFGNIGPKTYQKVFELILRLKGNLLWPAMHRGTTEFGTVMDNLKLADDWAIVMGSAHNEPMNRDANRWNKEGTGPWRYDQNRDNIYKYWEAWARRRGPYEAIWTMGMRGVGDTAMKGPATLQGKVAILEHVIRDQRQLLAQYVSPDVAKVPQVFTPYKEALAQYDAGLKLPGDVTIMWPDDNYGYIRQLSTPAEQRRSGASGVYYHISYLGWPRPYLWINTTPPALIWEEMTKAYAYGANRMWVVNVGDIKPGEVGIDFWMKLGWKIDRYGYDAQTAFLKQWATQQFGQAYADRIASIMNTYYQLGFQRKPDLMIDDLFSVAHYGEAQRRLGRYQAILAQAESIYGELPAAQRDAFYELVLYPVRISAWVTQAFTEADISRLYAKQGRITANQAAAQSKQAVDRIKQSTAYYNDVLAGGKWRHMMTVKGIGGSWSLDWPDGGHVKGTATPHMGVVAQGQGVPLLDDAIRRSLIGPLIDLAVMQGKAERGWRRVNDGRHTYLVVPNGAGDQLKAGQGPKVHYTFDVPKAGRYSLFMLINAPTNKDDSWFLKLDNGKWMTWNNMGTRSEWDWRKQGEYSLTAGRHTLTIAQREDGSMFSRIRFTERQSPRLLKDMFPDATPNRLSAFNPWHNRKQFIDVYNTSATPFTYHASADADWIKLSKTSGKVDGQDRLWVTIDWAKAPTGEAAGKDAVGHVTIKGAGDTRTVDVPVFNPAHVQVDTPFVESNGYVSMEAEDFTREQPGTDEAKWVVIQGLGRTGDAVLVEPVTTPSHPGAQAFTADSPRMEYDMTLFSTGPATAHIYCLPTHKINDERGLRFAIALDDHTPHIVNFYESGGHGGEASPHWRTRVSRNTAVSTVQLNVTKPGKHTLKVWMVDPGVVMDKLVIDMGGLKSSELGPPETTARRSDGTTDEHG